MVCQARFFLCVHGAHAVAAERPITHKPSTRWLRAAVGLKGLGTDTASTVTDPQNIDRSLSKRRNDHATCPPLEEYASGCLQV